MSSTTLSKRTARLLPPSSSSCKPKSLLECLTRTTAADPLSLLRPTSSLRDLHQIHAHLLAAGHLADPHSLSKFIALLAALSPHHLAYSHLLLAHSPSAPTVFALNTLIKNSPHQAFHFYRQILRSPTLSPDNYTFTFLIRAAALLSSAGAGPVVHAAAFKRGHCRDPHVRSGLIHMYAGAGAVGACRLVYNDPGGLDVVTQTAMIGAYVASGEIDLARKLFDEMPYRDHIAWNAMIAGYTHGGRSREALDLFSAMQEEGISVTEATMVSVLTACAQLGVLVQGRWAHEYAEKKKLRLTVTLGTALIDMYFKCGSVGKAMEVFESMPEKNVYTWSSAMSGLAMNGDGKRCVKVFEAMEKEGIRPNEVTFVAVLRGCSTAGLIEEGEVIFDAMKMKYSLDVWPEHYGCMVDLYGRSGQLEKALNFISKMPFKPHVGAWGALLNACRIYRNIEIGELAMSKIVELEAMNDAAYVLLSNIYADSRDWKGVSGVRETMKARGVRKEPGCSTIEVKGEVHEFFVGDRSHSRYQEIEAMLGSTNQRLKLAGFEARTDEVLFDIEEEEKETALCWHSEKLAIAFGLIALEEGEVIRVAVNLRMCLDCHDAIKLISKVFDREIVVRDRNRFHHLKDGECSCLGYW